MQAVIMAAGRGRRLGNLTDDRPKAFLEVRSHRLIDYSLALLHWQGVNNIKIVTGYRCEMYEELVSNVNGVECIFNPFYEMCNVLGSFYIAQNQLEDEDTIYMHADTLCAPEIFCEMIGAQGDIVMPVDFRPCDSEAMKVVTKNGKIIQVSKDIPDKLCEGEFIGIAKLSASVMPSIKKACKKIMQDKCFESYFEEAIQKIIKLGGFEVLPLPVLGRFWGEVDFLEDYDYVCNNLPDTLLDLVVDK